MHKYRRPDGLRCHVSVTKHSASKLPWQNRWGNVSVEPPLGLLRRLRRNRGVGCGVLCLIDNSLIAGIRFLLLCQVDEKPSPGDC